MIHVLRALAGLALIVPAAAGAHPSKPVKAHPTSRAAKPAIVPSEDTRRVAEWVIASKDNHSLPWAVVDKPNAAMFLFDPEGKPLGAVPVRERVVRDGNLITGGGVTAGIDFALTIAAELAGEEEAQSIQLALEYAPAPPFNAGSPDTAPASVLKRVTARSAAGLDKRRQIVDAALRAMSH